MTAEKDAQAQAMETPHIHEVLIVGAGPCGLAVAARLRESTPSALFTDDEHNRYHWIARNAPIKSKKAGQAKSKTTPDLSSLYNGCQKVVSSSWPSMLVLDGSGDSWLAKWKGLFAMLEISHLRSPMFFHPDPQDRDGLLAYAYAKGRSCECYEITGCIGKEVSKHRQKRQRNKKAHMPPTIEERDRKDYFAPSTSLFNDHCEDVIARYGLNEEGLIVHEHVIDIDFNTSLDADPTEGIFTVRSSESVYHARAVVLAIGAGKDPAIPDTSLEAENCPCICHALSPPAAKPTGRRILVVGGGLTAAQTADQAVRRGASDVHLIMRGPLKIKPFDVDLSWMGKFHNNEKASFWSADTDGERASMIQSARGGGSIPARYASILKRLAKTGRLTIHTRTEIKSQKYDPDSRTTCITTEPSLPNLPPFDMVYYATGIHGKIGEFKFMQTIHEKYPVETYAGLPALTNDLRWREDVPLYITGKFAGLRLGPGAGNLEGARLGAERIAWALENGREGTGPADTQDYASRYAMGIGSRFEQLAV